MLTHCTTMQHMGRAWKTRKGKEAGVEKEVKCERLQQILRDLSVALLSTNSPLLTAPTDEDMFGDLLHDEPMGLSPCSDSIDDLLMVRELMQLVPGTSLPSAIVHPRTHALSGKKQQWNRYSEVCNLFQEDPRRLGHPLKIETKNRAGKVVPKIRYRMCKNLFLYHNSSWTIASNHILSHKIYTMEDIASSGPARKPNQSGEPFPSTCSPTLQPSKKTPLVTYN